MRCKSNPLDTLNEIAAFYASRQTPPLQQADFIAVNGVGLFVNYSDPGMYCWSNKASVPEHTGWFFEKWAENSLAGFVWRLQMLAHASIKMQADLLPYYLQPTAIQAIVRAGQCATLILPCGFSGLCCTDPTTKRKTAMSMIQEFKEFAVKGNVIDMAVGVIIGTAFGKIVSSFVADVVMPPIGVLLGGVNFSDLAFMVKEAVGESPAVVVAYGKFAQTVIDFTIIAFVIFMVVRVINSLKKKAEAAPSAPAAPSAEQVLLTEIRDLLKK